MSVRHYSSDDDTVIDESPCYQGSVLERVRLTRYAGNANAGGMTLWLHKVEDAKTLCDLLNNQAKNNPHRINRGAFRAVTNEHVPVEESLCVSGENPRLLHIATIGLGALDKIDSAMMQLFGEHLPKRLRETMHRFEHKDIER